MGRKKRFKDKPAAPLSSRKKLAMSHYDIDQHREGKCPSPHKVTGIHWYPLTVLSAGLQSDMAPKPRCNLAKELQEAQSHWQVHERQMSLIKY